jgi:hypothetical protein
MSIQFKSKIKKIEHKTRIKSAWKEGDEIKTEEESLGWFMLLNGSWEYLHVGYEKPTGFEVGDAVVVTIAKEKE